MVLGFAASTTLSGDVDGWMKHAHGVGVGGLGGPDSDETDEDGMETESEMEEEDEGDMDVDALAAHVTTVFKVVEGVHSPGMILAIPLYPYSANRIYF
jgi:hypothetical protein